MTDDTQPWRLSEAQTVEFLQALKADVEQPGMDGQEEVDEVP